MDFGTAKVYPFCIINLESSNTKKSREETASGMGSIAFKIYYSDSDVKGTINGEPAALKKGWNVVGNKKDLKVSVSCPG